MTPVGEVSHGILSPDDDLAWAMQNFERYGMNYLPVCAEGGHFEGFLSKTEIFGKYRKIVRDADAY